MTPAHPNHRKILGPAWALLPPPVREMHDLLHLAQGRGRASVRRGNHPLARLAGFVLRFPASGENIPLTVTFKAQDGEETWTRDFDGRKFSSRLRPGAGKWEGLLVESFGPAAFAMALALNGERLDLVMRGWRLFGLPMPLFLCPRFTAFETGENGAFNFDVEISHPLTGLIVHYRGTLSRVK